MATVNDYIKNKAIEEGRIAKTLELMQNDITKLGNDNTDTNVALNELTDAVLELADIIGG